MKTTTSTKAGAAFLAGVVVALGGAVVYLKVTDSHPKPSVQVSSVEDRPVLAPETPSPQPAIATAQTPAQTAPALKEQPQPTVKTLKPKPVFTKPRITSRPVSLAVSHPKNDPMPPPEVQSSPEPAPVQSSEPATPQPVAVTPVPAPVPAPQPHTVTLPAGTSLAVRLTEKLSTDHNFTGDTFRATLDTPIISDGFIIADKGAKVLGRVVRANKPGKLNGMAELSLALTEISTTDGQRLHVSTNESLRKGPSNTNEEVLKMGGGAALGAIIGAIAGGGKGAAIGAGAGGAAGTGAVLLGHGKPAVIENETRLSFALAEPATITEQLNQSREAADIPAR
jgi:hypothetical protein